MARMEADRAKRGTKRSRKGGTKKGRKEVIKGQKRGTKRSRKESTKGSRKGAIKEDRKGVRERGRGRDLAPTVTLGPAADHQLTPHLSACLLVVAANGRLVLWPWILQAQHSQVLLIDGLVLRRGETEREDRERE